MKEVKILYKELEQEFIDEFKKLGTKGLYERAVLATSENDVVTARRMRFVPDDLTLYCYCDRYSRKYHQIEANPNVAVVVGYIQLEGTATLKGHPFDHLAFTKAYQESMPQIYETWRARQPPERKLELIEINPKRIAVVKYSDDTSGKRQGSINVLDVEKKEAYRLIDVTNIQKDHKDAPKYSPP